MLTLARALSRHPDCLLADELSLGLAPVLVRRLLTAIRDAADTASQYSSSSSTHSKPWNWPTAATSWPVAASNSPAQPPPSETGSGNSNAATSPASTPASRSKPYPRPRLTRDPGQLRVPRGPGAGGGGRRRGDRPRRPGHAQRPRHGPGPASARPRPHLAGAVADRHRRRPRRAAPVLNAGPPGRGGQAQAGNPPEEAARLILRDGLDEHRLCEPGAGCATGVTIRSWRRQPSTCHLTSRRPSSTWPASGASQRRRSSESRCARP